MRVRKPRARRYPFHLDGFHAIEIALEDGERDEMTAHVKDPIAPPHRRQRDTARESAAGHPAIP